MSFWSDIEGSFNPGGDPEAIHGAANATRALAGQLSATASGLDHEAKDLLHSWKGVGHTSASEAFQEAWSKFSTSIKDYAENLDGAAAKLDNLADDISSAQEQATHLKETALASLAIGGAMTIFTFGISDAAAEASVMADVAVATGMMTALDAALADAAAILSGLVEAFVRVAAMFAMGAGMDVVTIMGTRLFQGLNPFDPDNYSASDISNILLSGDLALIFGFAAGKSSLLNDFLKAHPVSGKLAYSGLSSLAGGPFWQIMILGKPDDLRTWESIVESAGVSAVSAAGVGALGLVGGPVGAAINGSAGEEGTPDNAIAQALNQASEATGITQGDWVRNGISLPTSVIKYALFGASPPPDLQVPEAPPPPAPPPVPEPPETGRKG